MIGRFHLQLYHGDLWTGNLSGSAAHSRSSAARSAASSGDRFGWHRDDRGGVDLGQRPARLGPEVLVVPPRLPRFQDQEVGGAEQHPRGGGPAEVGERPQALGLAGEQVRAGRGQRLGEDPAPVGEGDDAGQCHDAARVGSHRDRREPGRLQTFDEQGQVHCGRRPRGSGLGPGAGQLTYGDAAVRRAWRGCTAAVRVRNRVSGPSSIRRRTLYRITVASPPTVRLWLAPVSLSAGGRGDRHAVTQPGHGARRGRVATASARFPRHAGP